MTDKDSQEDWPEKTPKLRYTETLMYGHYSISRLRKVAASLTSPKKESDVDKKKFPQQTSKKTWKIFNPTAQDLIFLTLLGFTVAIFSFVIDVFCDACILAHRWLYRATDVSVIAQYIVWVLFPVVMMCFSTGFSHFLGPTAFGSGIPEVKTILTGVNLKEYLNFSTLVSKVVGLSFSLGSGMPLGKLGPFVHVGSATAKVLSKFFPSKAKMESIHNHVITAGAAVGVSCIFATPIGGVMYSVEATATNYTIKNFWRCLYTSMCGAITFGLFTSWVRKEGTILPFFKTNLKKPVPYDVLEILIFIFLGLICGLLGALFVYCHQSVVLFIRRRKKLNALLQKTRFLYPAVVTLVIYTVLFPAGAGQYMAGHLTLRELVFQMFDNRTWTSAEASTIDEARYLEIWRGPHSNAILTLFLCFIMRFWMCAVATTLPVPCGIFIPAFSLGASFGRLFGECMAYLFPEGLRGVVILPGAYSMIGAAALSGAMSHTVSPAVIVFEMTGYLGHILPCVIAVCVAGAVANFLRPSVYDAIIQIKNLPFLPPVINPHETNAYEVTADDMVNRDVQHVYMTDTLEEVLERVSSSNVEDYPVLRNKEDKIFVGSIATKDLKRLIIDQAKEENKEDEDELTSRKTSTSSFVGRIMARESRISQNLTGGSQSSDVTNSNASKTDEISSPGSRRTSRFSIVRAEDENLKKIKQLRFKKDNINLPESQQWKKLHMGQLDLKEYVDFAAFHISDKSSLYKVHWLFSYLNIHQTYVTEKGAFIGILKLPAVMRAISNPIEPKPYFTNELEQLLKVQ